MWPRVRPRSYCAFVTDAYTFGNNPQTRRRALPIAKTLMAAVEDLVHEGLPMSEENAAVAGFLAGWWLHVNALAADYVDRIEAGSTIQAIPTYRSITEHVNKMIWLAQTGNDGLTVIEFATWDKRRVLIEEMERHDAWPVPEGVEVGAPPGPNIRNLKDDPEQGRLWVLWDEYKKIEKVTLRVGGPNSYTLYRHLSDYTHPTFHTANAYTELTSNGTFRHRTTPSPREGGDPDVLYLPILLMQAGLTVSAMLERDPFRRVVDKAARDYGVRTIDLLPAYPKPSAPDGSTA